MRHIFFIKVSADANLLDCKTILKSLPKYFVPILLLCCILQKQLVNWSIGEYNVIVYWYIWLIFHIYDKWLLFHISIDWLIDWFLYIFVYFVYLFSPILPLLMAYGPVQKIYQFIPPPRLHDLCCSAPLNASCDIGLRAEGQYVLCYENLLFELMMNWWWNCDELIMTWRWADDEMILNWLWTDDELMKRWWAYNELIISWWWTDDELMMSWWYTGDELMVRSWW